MPSTMSSATAAVPGSAQEPRLPLRVAFVVHVMQVAGAEVLVAGSAVFGGGAIESNTQRLREAMISAKAVV